MSRRLSNVSFDPRSTAQITTARMILNMFPALRRNANHFTYFADRRLLLSSWGSLSLVLAHDRTTAGYDAGSPIDSATDRDIRATPDYVTACHSVCLRFFFFFFFSETAGDAAEQAERVFRLMRRRVSGERCEQR